MVKGTTPCLTKCIVVFSCVSCVFSNALQTTHLDESTSEMDKRVTRRDPMLHYLLVAMAQPPPSYAAPQILSRGVRRMGSEFLGKRSTPSDSPKSGKVCETSSCLDDRNYHDAEDLKKEQLSFTGQYDEPKGPDDLEEVHSKRAMRRLSRDSIARYLSLMMNKKMGSEFLGKRAVGSEFLGGRAMGSKFMGNRMMGSEFLGKRVMGSEFLGKRAMGSEFLGKRAMGSEFLGKRAMGSEFLGKRAMGSEFLGKRVMGSEFLGKRAMGSEFLGKRAMGSEFLGKRDARGEMPDKHDPWEHRMVEQDEEQESYEGLAV